MTGIFVNHNGQLVYMANGIVNMNHKHAKWLKELVWQTQ